MTNIELHFLGAATRFFLDQNNKKIDWEQRRFQASAIILGGMCSNYSNSYRVEDAIKLADHLIKLLKEKNIH